MSTSIIIEEKKENNDLTDNIVNNRVIDTILPDYNELCKLETKTFWTKDVNDFVDKIADECLMYKNIHSNESKKYMSRYNSIIYISIILGPLVGMLSAININLNDTKIIPIVILCISFLNGILISVIKFRRWDEGSLAHKTSAAKYSALYSNAKRQLSLDNKNREDSANYLRWITHTFNNIFLTSPIIGDDSLAKGLSKRAHRMLEKDLDKEVDGKSLGGNSLGKKFEKKMVEYDSKDVKIDIKNIESVGNDVIRNIESIESMHDGILNYELKRFLNNRNN